MKVVGIISEYNPFHNGHMYHINAAKDACNADYVVCIMSGSFVQRGEPAIFDKWSRAKMAVMSGADLVLELPFVYACQPAEIFAFGAVKLLNDINIIDSICFGSELGNTDILYRLANILSDEPIEFKAYMKKFLSEGYTFPKAVSLALSAYAENNECDGLEAVSEVVGKPNNILGIEYIKALIKLKSSIEPVAVKRIVSDYNETEINNSITSATSIRKEISKNGVSEKIPYSMPASGVKIVNELLEAGKHPIFLNNYSDIILYRLRSMELEEMQLYLNTKEGIEHRLKKAAAQAADIDELIEGIKTKRYTRTFIQRLLCHILIGLKEHDIQQFKNVDCPSYARVLSFNENGKQLLKRIKENEDYPIITKVANYTPKSEELKKMFYFDLMASDIYNLGHSNKSFKKAGSDFLTSPMLIYKNGTKYIT